MSNQSSNWYKTKGMRFNEDKAIPFMKLSIDLVDTISKYHRNQTRMGRYNNYLQLAVDVLKTASKLACSIKKSKELIDNLFCTGDIQTIDYCPEVYRQYSSGEQFDYFLWKGWEIKKTLSKLHPEMIKFKNNTMKFSKQIKKFIQKESITQLNSYKLQRIFVNDLKTQFRKMIIKDGKYKSQFCAQFRGIKLSDTEPIFIERILFFKIKKC